MGSSRKDLRAFPAEARGEAGHDLFLVQKGESPRDWNPKRTPATASQDLETARERYREMLVRRAKES
jgi:phage-related protein